MSARTPKPMTAERLAEIAARVPDGYDGPWYHQLTEDGRRWLVGYPTDNPLAGLIATVPDYGEHLARFIAHAREDIPALLAEVTRLRSETAADHRTWKHDLGKLREARAEVTRLRSEAAASRAAVLDEAADAVARFTGNDLDANAKMLRRMAAAARDAQTGGE